MTDLVDISGSKLDERTNTLLVSCKSAPMGEDENDAPGFNDIPLMGSGGVTCRPWPKDSRGSAQALVDERVPGANGAVTNWRDPRVADVVAELGEGESCLHSTGPGFESRFFCKDQLAAMIVGDDCAMVMDRENKKFSITCFGCTFQMSEADGIVLSQGGLMIQLKDLIQLIGMTVIGGRSPTFPMACVNPASLPAPSPVPGVFMGT